MNMNMNMEMEMEKEIIKEEVEVEVEGVEVEQNDLSLEELNSIREKIEAMNHFNQEEEFRIFQIYEDVQLNENKYGVHINLTCLKKEVLEKVKLFIGYVNKQETDLDEVEKKKEIFKNTYFCDYDGLGLGLGKYENKILFENNSRE